MCGINGIISSHRDSGAIVHAMNRHLRHRGPDGTGVYLARPLALGHVRLSIIDLTDAGAQPMQYDRWVLVFNGEIYNFQSLHDILVTRGYHFVSRCDTEVLLKAWDCWGIGCLERLEGMFAFAIFDTQELRLHLCRDGYGIKPLFYSLTNDEMIFSSELATLVHTQAAPPQTDYDALATFLALNYVPAPQTGLEGVFKLVVGHYLTVNFADGCIVASEPIRWHQPFKAHDDGVGITVDAMDQALAHSVHQQMVSDVPLGAFLSGGVDSSLICHYASQVLTEPLHTFCLGFSDAGPEYDETVYAAIVAKQLGAQHHVVRVELRGLTHQIDDILGGMGELNSDSSVILNYIVCAAAREHVTVCLSGAGGDELFGGYNRYQALQALDLLNLVPRPITRLMRASLSPFPQNRNFSFGNLVRLLISFLDQLEGDGSFLAMLRHDRLYPQQSQFLDQPPVHSLLQALEFDFRYFLGDNILSFTDKMSMLHGMEVRVPFLAPEVVLLAGRMQNSQRVTFSKKKILLKELAARYFPRDLIYRKKHGFVAPLEVWLRQLSELELRRRCLDGPACQLVGEDKICDIVEAFVKRRRDLSLQIYAMIVMNKWFARL